MWIKFPDTRGIPLEEVADLFGDKGELYSTERQAADETVLGSSGVENSGLEKSPGYTHVEKPNGV